MASDALDTVVSMVSLRSIGKRDAGAAATLAFVFVLGDRHALLVDACGPRRRVQTQARPLGAPLARVGP